MSISQEKTNQSPYLVKGPLMAVFQVATLNPVVFLLGIVVNLQEKVASKLFCFTFPHTLVDLGQVSLGSQVLYAGEMLPEMKAESLSQFQSVSI